MTTRSINLHYIILHYITIEENDNLRDNVVYIVVSWCEQSGNKRVGQSVVGQGKVVSWGQAPTGHVTVVYHVTTR